MHHFTKLGLMGLFVLVMHIFLLVRAMHLRYTDATLECKT